MTTAKEKTPTIWCLFSVDDGYDQPQNNLAAWWQERPSIEKLARYLCHPLDVAGDPEVVAVVAIWQGTPTKFASGAVQGVSYRLVEVPEGGV